MTLDTNQMKKIINFFGTIILGSKPDNYYFGLVGISRDGSAAINYYCATAPVCIGDLVGMKKDGSVVTMDETIPLGNFLGTVVSIDYNFYKNN